MICLGVLFLVFLMCFMVAVMKSSIFELLELGGFSAARKGWIFFFFFLGFWEVRAEEDRCWGCVVDSDHLLLVFLGDV